MRPLRHKRTSTADSWSTVSEFTLYKGESTIPEHEIRRTAPLHGSTDPSAVAPVSDVQALEIENSTFSSPSSSSEILQSQYRSWTFRGIAEASWKNVALATNQSSEGTVSDGLCRSATPHSSRRRLGLLQKSPWLTHSSNATSSYRKEDESQGHFRDSDWTAPDSSYGAAIPVFGWIPKSIRRLIETTMIAAMVLTLVYLVVTTSIRVSEESGHINNSTNAKNNADSLYLDDDRYIEYTSQNNNDDAVMPNYTNGSDEDYSYDDDDTNGNGDDDYYGARRLVLRRPPEAIP
jgi:hypothetical protein